MTSEQIVQVNDLKSVREAARQYMLDNVGWRAEDRDLVWSFRLVSVKLALLERKVLSFGELTQKVQDVLLEAPSDLIKRLTAALIAEKICCVLV